MDAVLRAAAVYLILLLLFRLAGRRTLAETGRLLHLVRDEADELGLQPAPGVEDLPALVEEFRQAGLAVDARLDLPDTRLPGGVDVSAYRVVQEALTNAAGIGRQGQELSVDLRSAGRKLGNL